MIGAGYVIDADAVAPIALLLADEQYVETSFAVVTAPTAPPYARAI
jgi:hypothetical protein